MNRYIVRARFPGEELDLREFITPSNSRVLDFVECASSLPGDPIQNAWNVTVCSLRYPELEPVDYHYREAFVRKGGGRVFIVGQPMFSQTAYEFFQLPFETLALGVADCDDSSIAATSVLRNFAAEADVFCTFGRWRHFGHAWVSLRQNGSLRVLETTKAESACRLAFQGLEEGGDYEPWVRFNDKVVEVLVPGVLSGEPPRQVIEISRIGLHSNCCAKIARLRNSP